MGGGELRVQEWETLASEGAGPGVLMREGLLVNTEEEWEAARNEELGKPLVTDQ